MLDQQHDYKRKYTFWMLLNEYTIKIPIMQRDYAQGRKSETVTAIRSELIDAIHSALTNEKNIDFDFVYGTLTDGILYPLDGQQRLTTLYLLHWYIACKEGVTDIARKVLHKFSYETRISSREFCEKLVELDYIPREDESPSDFIRNQNMYFEVWDNDPTISSMLVMLNVIHDKFISEDKEMFSLLTRNIEENPIITFSYLPMENYSLTDDLYIKMNARGKNLSDFENFKAKFILHMKKNGFPYEHFEKSIDTSWTDLLWDYRSKINNTIDEQFMYLFLYFTEMLYLEHSQQKEGNSPFKVSDIRSLITFYDSSEKIEELYELLDLWSNKDDIDNSISGTFSDRYEEGKVRIFDDKPDLMNATINKNSLNVYNKVILFLFMKRIIFFKKKGISDPNLNDYVRIIRNLVIKVRQRKSGLHSSDFRFCRHGIPYISFGLGKILESENIYRYVAVVNDQRVNNESLNYEKDKAYFIVTNPQMKDTIQHLEDLDEFRSFIHNVMPIVKARCIKQLPNDVEKVFNKKHFELLVRALLSIDDYGIRMGNSFYGDRYYYGDRSRDWYNILSISDRLDYPSIISGFFEQYYDSKESSIQGRLNSIIIDNLSSIKTNDWRYYFAKYPRILANYPGFIYSDSLVLLLENLDNSTFAVPHRLNGKSLLGYHACALYLEVSKQLCGNTDYVRRGKGIEDLSCLSINSGLKIRILPDNSIRLTYTEEGDVTEEIADKALYYNNQRDTNNLDNIERLVSMCHDVIKAEQELL